MTPPSDLVDADGRTRDRLDRNQPHALNAVTFLRAIPGLAERFREVPESFYSAAELLIDCPCGAGRVELAVGFRSCPGCGRVFLWTSRSLWAAKGEPEDRGGEEAAA